MEAPYLDTSALAKWYLSEPQSEAVEAYLFERGEAAITQLGVLEMRSLLARRRRMGEIDPTQEMMVFSTFEDDVRLGHLTLVPLSDGSTISAAHLISRLPHVPLRSLDALHLAAIQEHAFTEVATADQVMADAARALGIVVKFFG